MAKNPKTPAMMVIKNVLSLPELNPVEENKGLVNVINKIAKAINRRDRAVVFMACRI